MNKIIGTDFKGRTIIETDFWDGGDWLLELLADENGKSALLHYRIDTGESKSVPRFETEKHVFLPAREPLLHQVRFSRYLSRKLITPSMLFQRVDDLLVRCLDLDEDSRFLVASFVVSTWLIDCLPVAPYLALVGVPGSGKSTALRVLRLLCHRSLLTSDISSAAFYNLCTQLVPTLLIDETETSGHGHGRPQGGRDPAKPFHVLPYTCNCTALQYCRTNACSKACAGWLMPSPPRAVRRNPLAPARAGRAPPERPAAWHEHSRCEMLGRQPCCAWSKSVRSGGPTRTPLSLCTNPPVLRRLSHNSAARRSRAPPAPSYSLRLCM